MLFQVRTVVFHPEDSTTSMSAAPFDLAIHPVSPGLIGPDRKRAVREPLLYQTANHLLRNIRRDRGDRVRERFIKTVLTADLEAVSRLAPFIGNDLDVFGQLFGKFPYQIVDDCKRSVRILFIEDQHSRPDLVRSSPLTIQREYEESFQDQLCLQASEDRDLSDDLCVQMVISGKSLLKVRDLAQGFLYAVEYLIKPDKRICRTAQN